MEENNEKPEITGRNQDGTFQKGVSGNPNGKPKGTESFATKWYKMIDKIAEANDITADEVELELVKVGYKRAKDGDYSFYRDAMDRIHGKPVQPTELSGKNGQPIKISIPKEVAEAFNIHATNEETIRSNTE